MKRLLLFHFPRWTIGTTAIALLAGAILSICLHFAASWLEEHPEWVSLQIAGALGTDVRIERIEAHWHLFKPMIILRGIQLGSGDQAISLSDAHVDIGLLDVIRNREFSVGRLTLSDLKVHIVRETDGRIHLVGIPNMESSGEEGEWRLPTRIRLLNAQLVWEDRQRKLAPIVLTRMTMTLSGASNDLRIRGNAVLRGRKDNLIHFNANWDTVKDTGQTQFHIPEFDHPELFAALLPKQIELHELSGDISLWLDWQSGQVMNSVAQLQRVRVTVGGRRQLMRLSDIYALVRWQREGSTQRLALREFTMQRDGRFWPRGEWLVESKGEESVTLSGSFARLEDLRALLKMTDANPDLQTRLDQLQPRGELKDFVLQVQRKKDAPPDWLFSGNFQAVGIDAWNDVPELDGLQGSFKGTQRVMHLHFSGGGVSAHFPKLFRWPLYVTELKGDLVASHDAGHWHLRTRNLQLRTEHLESESRFDIHARPGQPLFIDLQTDFRNADAAHASRYYPAVIMREDLVTWLDKSVLSGRIPQGRLLFYGNASDFPFKQHQGHFEVLFDVRDIKLAYREGWPALRQAAMRLRFHNNSLDIFANKGRIYGNRIIKAHARIAELNPVSTLRIRGQVFGPFKDKLRLLQEPSLKKDFGGIAQALQVKGSNRLSLDLTVPLADRGDYRLQGTLHLKDNQLALPGWKLDASKINGELFFDLEKLWADNIQAEVFARPVRLTVKPAEGKQTVIHAQSKLGFADLAKAFPAITNIPTTGESDFDIWVAIPGVSAKPGTATEVLVRSQLHGLGIQLPEPFAKNENSGRSLLLNALLFDNDHYQVEARYGENIHANILLAGRTLPRISLHFGDKPAAPPKVPQLRISGRLFETDAAAWLHFASGVKVAAKTPMPPLLVDLLVGKLILANQSFAEVGVKVKPEGSSFNVALQGKELDGTISIAPDDNRGRIDIHLRKLALAKPEPGPQVDDTQPTPPSTLDPRQWPAINMLVENFSVGEKLLGTFEFQADRNEHGLSVNKLTLDGDEIQLDAKGKWLFANDISHTTLSGRLRAKQLEALLYTIGQRSPISRGKTRAEWYLSWPGDPSQVGETPLSGNLKISIGKGSIRKVDPGIGRLLGLLNFSALIRRLALDFRDLLGKGFAFDRIRGDFTLQEGVAHTENLRLRGPQANIYIKGKTDLNQRTLDQLINIVPKADATLAIAGTVAAGPLGGVLMYFAQSTLSGRKDKFNNFDYRVSGNWNDPKVEPLSGGPLSREFEGLKKPQSIPAKRP